MEGSILIPAYQPNERMTLLIDGLRRQGLNVVVVDDGSGPDCATLFKQAERLGAIMES